MVYQQLHWWKGSISKKLAKHICQCICDLHGIYAITYWIKPIRVILNWNFKTQVMGEIDGRHNSPMNVTHITNFLKILSL